MLAGPEFDQPPPQFDPDTIRDLLRARYGIDGELTSLDSERDQNVRVATAHGEWVVKVANAAEPAAVVDLQRVVLEHLADVDPGLPVPHIRPTLGGEAIDRWPTEGGEHLVRCVSWLPGRPLAASARTPALERALGRAAGRLTKALSGVMHPGAHRPDFLWNLDHAQRCRAWLSDIAAPADRDLVERALDRHARRAVPHLERLRAAVVHHDLNDHNLLVAGDEVTGIIDFGDLHMGRQVNELAVLLAYTLLDAPDLVATTRQVVSGYVEHQPLDELELQVLFDLVVARLAMSVAISSHRSRQFAGNDYLTISQRPALRLLGRLMAVRPDMWWFVARDAAGLTAVPRHDGIVAWMRSAGCRPMGPLPFDLGRAPRITISLAAGAPGTEHASDPVAYGAWLDERMRAHGAVVAFGAYGEDRTCYEGDQFRTDAPEPRSVHLGIDLFVAAGTPVRAMLPGRVVSVVDNDVPFDYGPTVVIEHEAGQAGPFWCLYGHLSRETLAMVRPGQHVAAGEMVATVGDHRVNGGWAPHVHVQLMTDLLVADDGVFSGNFEGAGEHSRMSIWRSIVPDANLLLDVAPETFDGLGTDPDTAPEALLARRRRVLGPSLSISYPRPLTIVRGEGAHLIDHTGRVHIDAVNNVCHVGHAHPRVVGALARQAAVLNTNTRYLHPAICDYAERLAATFPDPLRVVYLVNSGSEANELALRMARTVTGRHDVVALDWGYHGHTNDLVEISAYKFKRAGGAGQAPHVHLAELPDPYRGRFGLDVADAGHRYAESVAHACAAAQHRQGRGPAAFVAESISGCGGQVVFPPGYLAAAFAHARAAGALCIADEVQVGFGRVGEAMWAFELQGVVPDIVTLGKPIGNGHPLGAVVTTAEIAHAFANGMEFFSTFGGNPVSAAVGLAVLDVIADEGLLEHAARVGRLLRDGFVALQRHHEPIGDVRGVGLYLGVDLVTDRTTREPASELARRVAAMLRDRAVLVSTDGPFDNVLKIKPPMVLTTDDAEVLLAELDGVLAELG
jgi:4-aminobutyrate aminotransferase-like enzyme/Ser/Thr protein kinase RdoA (MazF antagonist)